MNVKLLCIGSIGAIAETSEYQRQAYNQALEEAGISWNWNVETYKDLLKSNGGKDRLTTLGQATGQSLSQEQIDKVHTRKTEIAGHKINEKQVTPRPGVVELIQQAKKAGAKVAWVTTTGQENTDAILKAFDGAVTAEHFDHIFHRSDCENGKPSSDIYKVALRHFNVDASECVAVEDSLNSTLSSKNAGIFTITTLGKYHDEDVANISDMAISSLADTSWAAVCKAVEKANAKKHYA